jgi:biotin synthase
LGDKQDELGDLDPLEWVRAIAVARILMPCAMVRLSAGRMSIPESAQALAFLAGANSIFTGDKLLTTVNPDFDSDKELLDKLGLYGREPYKDEHGHAHTTASGTCGTGACGSGCKGASQAA